MTEKSCNCTGNLETCENSECSDCSIRDCPFKEPLHYHHDGCPACYVKEKSEQKIVCEVIFDQYLKQNPRLLIPDKFMEEFLEFAKKEYQVSGVVNFTHCEDDEEVTEEVESYISESMEALLLFKKYLKMTGVLI